MKRSRLGAALVTGAARRIGRAMARALAEDGYPVAVHYHASGKDALRLVADIRKDGGEADLFPCDLSDASQVPDLLRAVVKRFGKIEVLVNSASIFLPSSIKASELDLLDQHWAMHVRAPWALSSEFFKVSQKGSIINILDTKVTRDRSEFAAYLLSKKSLADLTRMAAVAFAPQIRVNAIAPGLILPPEGKGLAYLEKRAHGIPLKRKGDVKNIIQALRFLLQNDYVTGQTIFVDGGEHLV